MRSEPRICLRENQNKETALKIEMLLQNGCTFYDRQIIVLNVVLFGSFKLKIYKLLIIGIFENLDKLNKSDPLRYMANGSKNNETKFCHILTP